MELIHLGWRTKTMMTMFALSVILCFVPLFNLLAFEFCFVSALVLTLVHGLSAATAIETTHTPVLERWKRQSARLVGPCCGSLIPIVFNGMWVPNCNWLEGIRLFSLLVVLGGLIASGVGVVCGAVHKRGKALYLCVWLAAVVIGFLRFYFTPQVDVFTFFGGYFPGAIYDEVIQEENRILLSRLEDLGITTTIIVALARYRREASMRALSILGHLPNGSSLRCASDGY